MRAGRHTSADPLLSAVNDGASKPSSANSTINGTYSVQITHLVIDQTSKLALQIVLGAMAVLVLTGFCLVKIRDTLPRDSCSIGSTMGFLADAQLCDQDSSIIPEGAEYMDEKQLKDVFDGWVFSLGWWGMDNPAAERTALNTTQDSIRLRTKQDGKGFGIDVGRAGTLIEG